MAINELHRNNREEAYKFFIKCYNISPDFNESKDIFETLKKEIKK
jgi:hypothetical protein